MIYVYGAAGELLVEYKNVTSGPWGAETSTSYNVYMGTRLVARRVTGTAQGVPYARTEWLHRNHLEEVVGTDYSNLSGCMDCANSAWTYGKPFGSGGSDQFSGQKEDPETGLKYFGARYYHSSMARWISADSVMAHVYAPQSLNKYAYVRNDPVNFIDPDGRQFGVSCANTGGEGECDDWLFYWIGSGAQAGMEELDPYPSSGGGGGGPVNPYNLANFEKCRAASLEEGFNKGFLPTYEATQWLIEANSQFSADPSIVGAIWSMETDFRTSMVIGTIMNRKGEEVPIDYGPLQINNHWKLSQTDWQNKYNPGKADLKNDPWPSFLAGAHDLADHWGAVSNADPAKAILYWHGTNGDSSRYARGWVERYTGLVFFFSCLKEENEP